MRSGNEIAQDICPRNSKFNRWCAFRLRLPTGRVPASRRSDLNTGQAVALAFGRRCEQEGHEGYEPENHHDERYRPPRPTDAGNEHRRDKRQRARYERRRRLAGERDAAVAVLRFEEIDVVGRLYRVY